MEKGISNRSYYSHTIKLKANDAIKFNVLGQNKREKENPMSLVTKVVIELTFELY